MKKMICLILLCGLGIPTLLLAQEERQRSLQDMETNLWIGSYNTFRLSEKWFWRAEMHYRRGGYDGVPFVGRMAQIYNRHAINYLFSPNFNVSLGGVVRLDFTPEPGNLEYYEVVHEPRIWHEYLFVMPFPKFQAYHRVRIEHRWNRSNRLGDEWIFRNRWRYKFFMKVPLNNPQLIPGTVFFNPDVEIILQTGEQVIGSHIEDLRIYPSIGYISNPRVTYTAGLMYTTGQSLNDPMLYRQRWVLRVNAYISLDFRRIERQIPAIRAID